MPHSDPRVHATLLSPLTPSLADARAAFVARLKPGAHLLNGQCNTGEDLIWLRGQGYVVTACEQELADAKTASREARQPVRVCPLERMFALLPYDGIWVSSPLAPELPAFALQLQQLVTLLKPAAPLCVAIPHGDDTSVSELVQHAIRQYQLPLKLVLSEPTTANTQHSTTPYTLLLRDEQPTP